MLSTLFDDDDDEEQAPTEDNEGSMMAGLGGEMDSLVESFGVEVGQRLHIEDRTPDQVQNQYHDLFKSARDGDADSVRALLTRDGVDVDHMDKDQDTALHRAAQGGHLNVALQLVVHAGAALNLRNKHGLTPLLVSVSGPQCNHQLVKLLVESAADVALSCKRGRTLETMLQARAQGPSSVGYDPIAIWATVNAALNNPLRSLILNKTAKAVAWQEVAVAQRTRMQAMQAAVRAAEERAAEAVRAAQGAQASRAGMGLGPGHTHTPAMHDMAQQLQSLRASLRQVATTQETVRIDEVLGALSVLEAATDRPG